LLLVGSLLSPIEGPNAYLDPGSGSLILQVILAVLLGGLFILRSYWKKIKDGVRRIFTRQQEGEENDTE
ncbi:MAG: hypothetical protein MUO54_00615, partial [Anaerolineales bacterium]|nr:hypothetical protein [Anaerolineales bacterium]